MQKKYSSRMLTEAGMMIALSFILGRITLFSMPQGGSITAGQMIPILLFALRWGVGPGVMAGVVYGLLDAAVGRGVVSLIQFLLDYPLAFGALGLAGLFTRSFNERPSTGLMVAGTIIGVLGRFVFSTISGAWIFGNYAPAGQNPWVYSMLYNGTYLGVELIVALIVVYALKDYLFRMRRR